MTFDHLELGMRNGQASSQLLGLDMGIKYLIPNCWDWERELKIKFPPIGIGNENLITNTRECEKAYQKIEMQLGILSVSST